MRSFRVFILLGLLGALALAAPAQVYRYFGPHITAVEPWVNWIEIYNITYSEDGFYLVVWDAAGRPFLYLWATVPPCDSITLVLPADPAYVPGPEEVALPAVEGTFALYTASAQLRPKLSYRYGDTPSLSEFFLQDSLSMQYLVPNTVQAHFDWTGLTLMNPGNETLNVSIYAFKDGEMAGWTTQNVPPHTKFVRLSEFIWTGVGYADFDLVTFQSLDAAFPPPLAITGNTEQDRHVFFNGPPTQTYEPTTPGMDFIYAPIVGPLHYAPPGVFTQGSPDAEPCREAAERSFTHVLVRDLAVMRTEVTRQMWADLRSVQPDLPADPSSHTGSASLPVQDVSWQQAALFANLLSVQSGLAPCYYVDGWLTQPLDVTNYTGGAYFCDFFAGGYRLPTEGEWEYFCRAGSVHPFGVKDSSYSAANCFTCTPSGLTDMMAAVVFCANSGGQPAVVGSKNPNSWGLYDVHGNVAEWCWDLLDDMDPAYPTGQVFDHWGAMTGNFRVARGGSFRDNAAACRSAFRQAFQDHKAYDDLGFRLVRTIR